MKKLLGILVLGLLWCNVGIAANLTFVCQWKNGKNVLEIVDNEIYDDKKRIETTFLRVTSKNIEYQYITKDYTDPPTKYYRHFKLNRRTGTAFETKLSFDGTKRDSFHAKCEMI
tara:strand:+ start:109 stop:450 length:342 start_codon:yes stop_codon:yes gene_type:complete